MSIDEIINGQSGTGGFPGLVRLVEKYLDSMNVDITTRCEIGKYLSLVSQRASGMIYAFFVVLMTGKLWTTAKWMRHFIRNHPEYKHDSAVSKHVNYDLVRAVEKITKGLEREEGLGVELLGRYGLGSSGSSTPESVQRNRSSPKMNGVTGNGLGIKPGEM
jgi:glutamate--cysteine ligase catalytic subunit